MDRFAIDPGATTAGGRVTPNRGPDRQPPDGLRQQWQSLSAPARVEVGALFAACIVVLALVFALAVCSPLT
jgi:hypothetical protein